MTTEQLPPPARSGAFAAGEAGLKPVLSVAEVAGLFGVSEWLVLQQVRQGTLPHKRCGRRIVFSRDRLLMWLAGD